MPNWQERITRETEPAIRAEHETRYGLAAPLIAGAPAWIDLGCGTGIASAAALRAHGGFSGRAVLVDLDEDAARGAADELGLEDTVTLGVDLSTKEGVDTISEHLVDGAVVTCFEVVEHLATFVPLLERLVERADQVTAMLSVPNDAFFGIENPHHQTMWSEGAFAELQSQLPASAVALKQVQLQGSAILPVGAEEALTIEVPVQTQEAVATHFLAAFGPRAAELRPSAAVAQVDLDEQRKWVRLREADAKVAEELIAQYAEWKAYIHELEGLLGRPLSGT